MTLEELLAENEQLRAEIAALKRRLAELEALVKALQAQLESLLHCQDDLDIMLQQERNRQAALAL